MSDVLVAGMGYVGLTLAAGLAAGGMRVVGYDANGTRVASLRRGRLPLHEAGLAETIGGLPAGRLTYRDHLPDHLPPATILCVGTPVTGTAHQPDLGALRQVVADLSHRIEPGQLVVVRSTVPVGTSRRLVLPGLLQRVHHVRLAMCPERTIQGQALRELRELPQVIGGLDATSTDAAAELFARLSPHQVRVSSLEAAELVKLVNNAHTDVIYGFGNEVALIAEALGVDAHEVIQAANADYPRPDLCRPGFVGGGCLTKDPYLLMASTADAGHAVPLVAAARQLNETVPAHLADRLLDVLKNRPDRAEAPRVLVCGLAYKGRPPTDDMRGSAAPPAIARLREAGAHIVAHDHVVSPAAAAELGVDLVGLSDGFAGRDGVLVLTDHPGYAGFDARTAVRSMRHPAAVVDGWGAFARQLDPAPPGVTYVRYGRG